jgi:hypothetical protein
MVLISPYMRRNKQPLKCSCGYLHKNDHYTYKYNIYKAAQFINIVKYGTYKFIYEKE